MTQRNPAEAELKARFDIDGFVNYGRILDADGVRALGDRLDEIGDGARAVPEENIHFHQGLAWGPGTSVARRDAIWQLMNLHDHDELIRAVCEHPTVQNTIALFLEGPARLWSTQVIAKPAGHGATVPWHQDTSYWGQERRLTCWLAVDDATPFNGCMRMIPGTHRDGQRAFTPKLASEIGINLLETKAVNDETQVYVPVPAGCASFHHPLTLHASDANTTAHRRRAIAITYQAE